MDSFTFSFTLIHNLSERIERLYDKIKSVVFGSVEEKEIDDEISELETLKFILETFERDLRNDKSVNYISESIDAFRTSLRDDR